MRLSTRAVAALFQLALPLAGQAPKPASQVGAQRPAVETASAIRAKPSDTGAQRSATPAAKATPAPDTSKRVSAAVSQQRERERTTAWYNNAVAAGWGSVLVGIAVIVVTIVQSRALFRQADSLDETIRIAETAGKEQSEAMAKAIAAFELSAKAASEANALSRQSVVATQRPWLTVDASIASALQVKPECCEITIRFEVNNVGRSPALRVAVRAYMFPEDVGHDVKYEQRTIADAARQGRYSMRTPSPMGRVLFPGQQYSTNERFIIPKAAIDAALSTGRPDWISPYLVGVVDYKFDSDAHHQTWYAYWLGTTNPTNPQTPGVIRTTPAVIPISDLELRRLPDFDRAD